MDAVAQWYFGRCRDCQWTEVRTCDWTRDYARNLSRVDRGELQACIEAHPDKRVGKRLVFRAPTVPCRGDSVTTDRI